MKYSKTLLFLVFIPLLFSCTESKTGMPKSSGKTAELIVATNGDMTWDGVVGDSIRSFFGRDFNVLPQPEPLFEIAYLPIAKLEGSKMFRAHHNILIVDIDDKVKEPTINARKDVWASPQRVIRIIAPSDESFVKFFSQKEEVVYKILMDTEYERLNKLFYAFRDRDIMKAIEANFGFTLTIPGGFYIAKNQADFMWIRKETKQNSQGLLIYTYDYVDTLAFDVSRIISFRNSITKQQIPGPSEGSYMAVAEKYSPIISKRVNFKNMFTVVTRGLWKLEGDFMGGPFVNYTFVDQKNNKVVTIDGYVYAPNAPKRDLLIQVEAIIHSLSFKNQADNK